MEIEVNSEHSHCGIGTSLMEMYIEEVHNANPDEYILVQVYPIHTNDLPNHERLNIQNRLVTFYEKFGFKTLMNFYDDDELPLVIMVLEPNPTQAEVGFKKSSIF